MDQNIFDLKEENTRLLNELLFANKCLTLLEKYRNCLTLFTINCKCDHNMANKSHFAALENEYNCLQHSNNNDDNDERDNESDIEIISDNSANTTNTSNTKLTNTTNNNNIALRQTPQTNGLKHINKRLSNSNANKLTLTSIKCNKKSGNSFQYYSALINSTANYLSGNAIKTETETSLSINSNDQLIEHNNMGVNANVSVNRQLYGCEWPSCHASFTSKTLLESHLLDTHANKTDSKFVCDQCHQRFEGIGGLNQHKRVIHSVYTPKLYKCGINGCQYVSKKSNLNRHKLSRHTTYRPFKCPIDGCDKCFARNDSLKSHMKNHIPKHLLDHFTT